jgi:hypothetical protein
MFRRTLEPDRRQSGDLRLHRRGVSSSLIVGYECRSPAEAGQFTVPSYILLGMPAGSGSTTVNQQVDLTFSATGLGPATSVLTGEIEFSMPTTYK